MLDRREARRPGNYGTIGAMADMASPGCVRIAEQARRPVGCLDVAICADLVDPGRVNIFERWESQAALETFRSSGPDTEQRPEMLTVSVAEYDITVAGRVRGGCEMNRPDGLCGDR
jgi:quinol monooxygenase YgiN